MTSQLSRSTATFIGFTAVLLWSLLAFLTAASGNRAGLPAHRRHLRHRRGGRCC
jgi:hypothetical protein